VYRAIEVSAADAGWRLIAAARDLLGEPLARFGHYDKFYPESNVPLSFVLENSIMVARAMDQCTSLYMFESSFIAMRVRTVFIVLIVLLILIEIASVAILFQRAVAHQFKDVAESVEGLKELSPALVSSRIDSLRASMRASKRKRAAIQVANAATGLLDDNKSNQDSDDDAGAAESEPSSDSSDSEDGADSKKERRKTRSRSDMKSTHNSDVKLVSHTAQRLFIMLISFGCLVVILAGVGILCYLCISVINNAEAVGGEINNSCRRSFLAERLAYLSFELVHAGPDSVSNAEDLLGSKITWLRTVEIIRCQLDRTVVAMLSVHYALLYGDVAGWLDMAQGFEHGPVKEWGTKGSVDMCSPFTWDKEGFAKAQQVSGSFGRFAPQDAFLFQPGCLTELPGKAVPKSSLTFTHKRISMLSLVFVNGGELCPLYKQRCRFLDEQQYSDLSPAEKRVQVSSLSRLLNKPDADASYLSVEQCLVDSAKNSSNSRLRFTPRPDPCYATPYLSGCYYGKVDMSMCRCNGGELSPEFCTAQAGQARDFECGDPAASEGLHNFLIQTVEHARALSADPVESLMESNPNYRFVADYYVDEWRLGLLASTLIYQHEAIEGMRNNSLISDVVFGIVIATILIQYAFLAFRYAKLQTRLGAVKQIVKRLQKLNHDQCGNANTGNHKSK
jgi:hypothetical protein